MTTVVPLHFSEATNRALYLLTCEEELFYVVICRHNIDNHFCGYVNLERKDWNKVPDEIGLKAGVSYEGIGSSILSVPPTITKTLPIPEKDYWVGVDYFEKTEPKPEEIIDRLKALATFAIRFRDHD